MHLLSPKVYIELPNIKNRVKKAYILKNKKEVEFKCLTNCEGYSVIEIYIPKEFQNEYNYCICLEYGREICNF